MRIVHLVRATTWGGGERYVLDLCGESVRQGHQVTVVTRGVTEVDRRFSHLPLDIVKIPLGGTLDFSSPRRIAKLLLSMEDDVVVHVHTFKDAEIVARAKCLIGNRKAVALVCTRHLVKSGKNSFRWRFIYNAIDRLIFVSALARDAFLSSSPVIDKTKIMVIHNSVVIPSECEVRGKDEGKSLLLFTGRLSQEKGMEVLLKAFARLDDNNVCLRVCGTGSEQYVRSLRQLATDLGVANRVEWRGFVENVYNEIAEATVCVAPSVWQEPFGLTIIEFMSQGRPVVTTSNGAQSEIITDGEDGVLVSPGSVDELTTALQQLLNDAHLRRRIGDNARITFQERFTYPVFYACIEAAYREALTASKKRSVTR